MRRILINGARTFLQIDGMNRVLLETVRSLDKIVAKGSYTLVIPSNVDEECYERIKDLKNIRIRKTILPHFGLWSLLFVDIAGMLSHRIVISFHNRNSIFGGGINVLHDIIPVGFYKDQDRRYLRRIERLLNTSDCVIVPSRSTYEDIERTMNHRCRMQIIHHGWQHYTDIREDDGIFDEYPCIEKGAYYFTVSAISPHKNLRFLYEAAIRNPDQMFVVAGAMNRGYGFAYSELKNLMFVGRIRDEKVKALMMHCKAFIYPSLYEGAGLPPLEALSCKVPVLVSDIEVLHEYCADSVHYFDPYDHDLNIEDILKTDVADPGKALDLLSWDKAARELKSIVESCV